MQMQHLLDGYSRQHVPGGSNNGSNRNSSVNALIQNSSNVNNNNNIDTSQSSLFASSPTTQAPIYGRPLSLGTLLSSHQHTRASSIASKHSVDVKTGAADAPGLAGEGPTSSSSPPAGAAAHHSALVSPTASLHSLGGPSSSSAATAGLSTRKNVVALPLNEHGVRTRVNILPAAAVASLSRSPTTTTTASETTTKDAALHRASAHSAALLGSNYNGPSGTRHSSDTSTGAVGPGLISPRLAGLSLINGPASTASGTPHQQQHYDVRNSSHSASSIADSTRRVAPGSLRHAPSTSSLASIAAMGGRPDSPAKYAYSAEPASTSSYRFPSGTRDGNHTYTYGTAAAPYSAQAAEPGSNARSQIWPPLHSSNLSQSSSNGSTHASSNYFASTSGNKLNSTHSTPLQGSISGTYDSGTVSPNEQNQGQRGVKGQYPNLGISQQPPQSARAGHLAGLPKSLIPGGYDFSPVSASTHDTHHQQSPIEHNAAKRRSSAFAFARDRSASVPRTVSSFGDNDSGRSSLDRQHSREPLPDLDASFQTARQTFESMNMDTSKSSMQTQLSNTHTRDESKGTNHGAYSGYSSEAGSSRPSTDEQESSGFTYEDAPLISPIPPKLDLDFGSSSSFSLDFGSDFSSKSTNAAGSGGFGDGLGLSFDTFGSSSWSTSAPAPKAESFMTSPAQPQTERAKNDSEATTTYTSFLQLQAPPVASQVPSTRASVVSLELVPLSSVSVATIVPLRAAARDAHAGPSQSSTKSPDDDEKPLAAHLGSTHLPVSHLQDLDAVNACKAAVEDHTPTISPLAKATGNELHAQQSTAYEEMVGPHSQAMYGNQPVGQAAVGSQTQTTRSDSPASQPSSSSFSRPASSIFNSHAPASANSMSLRRMNEELSFLGDYTGSDDSRRTTLSSSEQLPLKHSQNSSAFNLSSPNSNQNVRLSMNKSLPPVPPTGDSAGASPFKPIRPGSVSSHGSFERSMSSTSLREQLGAGKRSHSEQASGFDERQATQARHKQVDSLSSSQGDFKTPQFVQGIEATRPRSQTSGSDTGSLASTSTTGYSSLDVTKNFTMHTAHHVTRVQRASSSSESITGSDTGNRHRLEVGRVPSTDNIASSSSSGGPVGRAHAARNVPLAQLARPKLNTQNTWPSGELRKKDAATDKVLLSATAKLADWLQRHADREMTDEEARWHNRRLSEISAKDQNMDMSSDKLQARSMSIPVATTSGSRNSDVSYGSRDISFEVQNAVTATASIAKAIPLKGEDRPERTTRSLEQAPVLPMQPTAKEVSRKEEKAPLSVTSTMQADSRSLASPAPPQRPPLGVTTTSSSLSQMSIQTCSSTTTAVQSSPAGDPAMPAISALRVQNKSKTGTPTSRPRRPIPPGGEQPWSQAWIEITEALISYKSALKQHKQDRASFCQIGFLQTFRQEELAALCQNRTFGAKQRNVLFDWIDVLFEDLQGTPPNRGACLDGIAAVIESRLMTSFAFGSDTAGLQRLEQTIAILLSFAVEKLNGKAIFANTLGFAGKMLAAAFWNLEGVALKLLRLLPAVKKQHVLRIVAETGIAPCPGTFPSHLDCLAYKDPAAEYVKLFPPVRQGAHHDTYLYKVTFAASTVVSPMRNSITDTAETPSTSKKIVVEMAGNWLIRWTATDSDLPFAFMRAYHRQLSNYLPLYQADNGEGLKSSQLLRAPGYAFISATLLEVCDALIHRNLRSVTTMAPSNTGVNANESANPAAGQKPKALEVVSKRVIQTIFEIVGGALQSGSATSTPIAFASAAMRSNFGCSISMWIKAVTKKTSMWDTRGIFALLDLIEGLAYNVCSPPFEEGVDDEDEIWVPSEIGLALFDTQFILGFIKTILSKADNTTCLLRTISFLYTEFQTFTLRPDDREELCDRILLDAEIFERLFLYYNVGVRGYFLRLLIYRLARLGSSDDGKPTLRDPRIFATLRLFEHRLEKIRKRHDQIDPLDDWDSDSSDEFRPRAKRSTICSTWGVHEKPWTMDLERKGRKASSETSEDDRPTGEPVEKVVIGLEDIQEDSTTEMPDLGHLQRRSLGSQRMGPMTHSMTLQVPESLPPIPQQAGMPAKKVNVAKSAKKVWNAFKNRKGVAAQSPNPSKSQKPMLQDHIAPFYDDLVPAPRPLVQPRPLSANVASLEPAARVEARSRAASVNLALEALEKAAPKRVTPEPQQPFPSAGKEVSDIEKSRTPSEEPSPDLSAGKPDFLKIDVAPPRLRKQSSRKSIRRAAANQANGKAASAVSPRSRRSSLYSFDLDVETPRSDSFDFPRSPPVLQANGGTAPASPIAGSGVLSISPVAFGALMDGALSFAAEQDDVTGDRASGRLTPGSTHRRHKSASSLKGRSRPVSVASDKGGPSPRVSKRFSKRASILPPPALDLLRESPSEPVPKIPEQYKTPTSGTGKSFAYGSAISSANRPPSPPPYAEKFHPYAVRGLREYEDCLDEWELFVNRVKEEEGEDGRELAALIPRLQCAWPSTWEE